jgi:anti-sigma B factor antagonist
MRTRDMDQAKVKNADTVSRSGVELERAASGQLRAHVRLHDGYLVVGFDNARLDALVAPELGDFLNGVNSAAAQCVVFDLSRVEVADSSALAAILRACRRMAAGVEVRIVAPSTQVARLLRITEVDRLVPVYVNLESALCGEEQRAIEYPWAYASAARAAAR